MRTGTVRRARRAIALVMAAGGTALLAVSPVLAADEVRTQSELFGFDLEADAAPLSVRFFDDFIPIPVDPGEPQFEITGSYTGTNLGTGPLGRAVASSIWPGAALGDGFGTVVDDESQSYPIRAEARYPGRGEDDWQNQTTIEGADRFGMIAEARGLDVVARSEGGGLPAEAAPLVAYGQVRSTSTSTVVDGQAVANGVASITDVELLEGIITLDAVETEVRATSDGTTAATAGATTIGAIEVLGMPVRLTEDGAVVVPPDEGGDDGDEGEDGPLQPVQDLLGPANQALQQLTDDLVADGLEETLGIRIEALDHTETIDGAIGERVATGVTITVDLAVLRGYLDPLLELVPIGELLDAVPDDLDEACIDDRCGWWTQLKGLLFEGLGLGPKVQYVIGSGFAAASATPPFELPEPPPLPPPPAAPVDTGSVGGGSAPPPSSGGVSLPPPTSSGPSDVPAADVAPPASSSPSVAAPAPVADPIEPFAGIPAAAIGISLLLGAVPTFGLRSIRETAVGVDATTDAPRPLPDLRGGA